MNQLFDELVNAFHDACKDNDAVGLLLIAESSEEFKEVTGHAIAYGRGAAVSKLIEHAMRKNALLLRLTKLAIERIEAEN